MKLNEYELKRLKKERMEEIDKWLDNEYGCSYTRLEELHDFVIEQDMKHQKEKDKEIERLVDELEEQERHIKEANFEIERLTELCNKYEEEHKTTFETWQKDIKENEQLHSIIKEVIEDLNNTKRLNHHFKDGNENEYVNIDIDHIDYLVKALDKGGEK